MRYEPNHEVFTPPDDPNSMIWRYIDFTKLVSMLETRALYFARSDRLGDEFEGSYSAANVRWRPKAYKDSLEMLPQMERIRETIRLHTYVNCWNLAGYESAALWGLYVPPHGGVAIRSSFRRLCECFLPSQEDEEEPTTGNSIFIGRVLYADYENDLIPENNMMWPFVYKRRSFEFENELRALIQHIPSEAGREGESRVADFSGPTALGREVTVDLDVLVEDIVVSPLAPTWFAELVRGVCGRYALDKEVIR